MSVTKLCFSVRGISVKAFACECGSCKNIFFMPKSEVEELPKCCPHCGVGICPEKIIEADITDALGLLEPADDLS